VARTELRLKDHDARPGEHSVEVWHGGKLVATIVGADGPGVRIMSLDYRLKAHVGHDSREGHNLFVNVAVDL
jgi:hypothetical protein